jgi:hypothetical protein
MWAASGCTDDPQPTPDDPCALRPLISGGKAEIGLGTLDDISLFSPVTEGQDITVQPGVQYLLIGVMNLRTRDMTLGSGERGGQVEFAAYDASGNMVNLADGCRVRDFAPTVDGYMQLTTPFGLPFTGAAASALDNMLITVRVDVRDPEGRQAWDEHSFVFRHAPR